MAELKKIRFLYFFSLMIFPTYALDVILSSARGDIKQTFGIKTKIINGEKTYDGTLNRFTYRAQNGTSRVIVHISSMSRFVEISRHAVRKTRLQIDQELRERLCELVILGIENFDDDEYHLISAFIFNKIQPHPKLEKDFIVDTIGDNHFDHHYRFHLLNFSAYQENAQICGGILSARLRSIPCGALRSLERNNKEIKLCDYKPKHRIVIENKWPIRVENNRYVPAVNVSDVEYNFKMRHPNDTIHLVILSGAEYSRATNIGFRSLEQTPISGILEEMVDNNEVLIILGAFNFDWTEVDIAAQIILCHSKIRQASDQNVFTWGFGIFNTIYQDVYDRRLLLQGSNPTVAEIMRAFIGVEVKQRSIDMYYLDNELKVLKVQINLANGRYCPDRKFQNFYFPWPNQKIAFIVYEPTELNDAIDLSMVCRSMEELERSGIHVVMIEAINFEWYDMHIIAEWIDHHRGNIDSEHIAVLGGGIFDTIFQSEISTYDTFLNKKNELQTIRNAYLKRARKKGVYALKIDYSNLELWSYPVNTVNGIYEPDLISDWNMLDTRDGRNLFFIITSAYNFRKIAEMKNVGSTISSFRKKIQNCYPESNWSVYLVCLNNFGERDSHLFTEFVQTHTNDERPFEEFVRTFSYGIRQAIYQYKDALPFTIEDRPRMHKHITSFFEKTCGLSHGTHFDRC